MIISRRHVRVKVMQVIYAFRNSENIPLDKQLKFLSSSIQSTYQLYILMLSLFCKIYKKAQDDLVKKRNKQATTNEGVSTTFIDNIILNLIVNYAKTLDDAELEKYWNEDDAYFDLIFKAITSSKLYEDYIASETSSFKKDKYFFIELFKTIIAPNDKLYEYVEDKNLLWVDDFSVVNSHVLRLLEHVKPNSLASYFESELYKNEDDEQFALDLLEKTQLNKSSIVKEIKKKTKNWDADRIASVDYVLLQMAICELNKFPSIPTRVTINEYIEMSKEYSTIKSGIFINGILDTLVKEYEEQGTLNKIGRGLV